MNNQITFKQYRDIDLGILCVVTAVFEAIATLATSKWFAGQPMAISITLALILIAMHRWGSYAWYVAAVGGVAFCVFSSASIQHFIIYCIGNLFALTSLLCFKLYGKEAVRRSLLKTLMYAGIAYLSVAVGRFLLSLPFGGGFSDLVGFLTSDILSLLFAVVILYVMRGTDGLSEDQKTYLLRLEKQRPEEMNGD